MLKLLVFVLISGAAGQDFDEQQQYMEDYVEEYPRFDERTLRPLNPKFANCKAIQLELKLNELRSRDYDVECLPKHEYKCVLDYTGSPPEQTRSAVLRECGPLALFWEKHQNQDSSEIPRACLNFLQKRCDSYENRRCLTTNETVTYFTRDRRGDEQAPWVKQTTTIMTGCSCNPHDKTTFRNRN